MISKPKPITKIQQDQRGLAAIIVVLIVIVLLTMIVFTFARISQRNQRQVLDRQLDTAAYYAAESGVNDAREWIMNNPTTTKDSCDFPASINWPESENLDGEELSSLCVLVAPVPDSLKYDNVGVGEPRVFPVQTLGGNLNSIEIAWQHVSGGTDFSCPSDNPPNWGCDPGVLQVDLIPFRQVGAPMNINRDYFLNNTMTVFARPSPGTGEPVEAEYSLSTGFGGQGNYVTVKCDATISATNPQHCKIRITNINALSPTLNIAYVKITPHYKSANLEVCSPVCGDGSDQLVGAQWLVDSTGRAADVLKRIQVRISAESFVDNMPLLSNAVHTTQTICKRFEVAEGVYREPGTDYPAECWLKESGPIVFP